MVYIYICIATCVYIHLFILLFHACRAKYDAVEVTALTYIPSSYMNKKVSYRYSVQNLNKCYEEYIHDLPTTGAYNRCLKFDQQTIKEEGNGNNFLYIIAIMSRQII